MISASYRVGFGMAGYLTRHERLNFDTVSHNIPKRCDGVTYPVALGYCCGAGVSTFTGCSIALGTET
jgi:hypothetical protein